MRSSFKILSFICLLSTAGTARAGYRLSPSTPPFIMTDLFGYSGATEQAASTVSWRFTYTSGYIGSPQILGNASGYVLSPGLWGGSSLRSAGAEFLYRLSETPPAWALIPAGAMRTDYIPAASTSPLTSPIHASPAVIQAASNNLSAAAAGYTFPVGGMIWEIFLVDATGAHQNGLLAKPATLTLPYIDSDNDGIIDGSPAASPVRVDTLSIWWLDESRGNWVRLPDPMIDTNEKTVSAGVSHFSVFAVMGAPAFSPSETYPYPIPWRPTGGNAGTGAGQTGTPAGGITFKNLPSLCTIRIYTVAGSLVKEINHTSGAATETWDVTSDAGEPLATGVYLWVVESNGSRKSGKLAVVR
ncbi:MAG: hypothetical protein IPI26_08305 [Elusimicrobia bacterium]|nr:hypothetical protein [Elusimicrobiota bacterium]MBK7575240.1 hypothetical protein [Elusimicrobiota bacterium]MBL0249922.1 hypothetical protein [Elusimicrobiota bacterium]